MINFDAGTVYVPENGNENWLKDFAFLAENRPRVKNVDNLKISIDKSRKVLSTIEVMPFDKNDPKCLLNGEYALVDLNCIPIAPENIDKVKYVVVDGMHRIYALTRLVNDGITDMSVKILIDPNLQREHIWDMNSENAGAWTPADYVFSYSTCGLKDYPKLQEKIDELADEGFCATEIIFYYSTLTASAETQKSVKKLEYVIDEEKGDKVIVAARLFKNVPFLTKKWNTQHFVRGLREMYNSYPNTFNPNHLAQYLNENNINLFAKVINEAGVEKTPTKGIIKDRLIANWMAYYDEQNTGDYFTAEQKAIIFDRDSKKRGDIQIVKCLGGAACTTAKDVIEFTEINEFQGDHWTTPKSAGGKAIIKNGKLICPPCNNSKNDRSGAQWLEDINSQY